MKIFCTVLCILSSLSILGYKLLVHKQTSDFRIPVKDTLLLTGLSTIIQILLVLINYKFINIAFIVPYLMIQGYTDHKTGYVYRTVSYIFLILTSICSLLMLPDIDVFPYAIIFGTMIFFVICSLFKKVGWGDTFTLFVVSMVFVLQYENSLVIPWIINMFLTSIMFVIYTMITKQKKAPFLPWLSLSTIITLLLSAILFA